MVFLGKAGRVFGVLQNLTESSDLVNYFWFTYLSMGTGVNNLCTFWDICFDCVNN